MKRVSLSITPTTPSKWLQLTLSKDKSSFKCLDSKESKRPKPQPLLKITWRKLSKETLRLVNCSRRRRLQPILAKVLILRLLQVISHLWIRGGILYLIRPCSIGWLGRICRPQWSLTSSDPNFKMIFLGINKSKYLQLTFKLWANESTKIKWCLKMDKNHLSLDNNKRQIKSIHEI